MHEYSLIQALVGRVEQEARARGATAIHRLTVRVGELAGVETGLFVTAYETFRAGTLCATARLELVRVPASWRCRDCHRPIPRGRELTCPYCGVAAELEPGSDGLYLDSIDMEVP